MVDIDTIRQAVSEMLEPVRLEDGVRVPTQCLYPSNGVVSVVIRGGENTFVVSDEGRAAAEASAYGLVTSRLEGHFKRLVRAQGLLVQNQTIFSPKVPLEAVGAAVVLVANASRDAAFWSLKNFKYRTRRNFKEALVELLGQYFKDEIRSIAIEGASHKVHHFDHVVILSGGKRILIDPVLNEASSINSRVVANLDVKGLRDPALDQRTIYDDSERWTSSDLSLLRIGAPTIPFSHASLFLDRLTAA